MSRKTSSGCGECARALRVQPSQIRIVRPKAKHGRAKLFTQIERSPHPFRRGQSLIEINVASACARGNRLHVEQLLQLAVDGLVRARVDCRCTDRASTVVSV